MKLELRLSVLSKLLTTESPEIAARLNEEFARSERTMRESNDFQEIADALQVVGILAPKYHMAILPLIEDFARNLPSRAIEYGGVLISSSATRYPSIETLIKQAIDVAGAVRYVHTESYLDLLLEALGTSVADKAVQALESLAKFDLDLFYGENGLGANPQARVLAHLQGLDDETLERNAIAVTGVLRTILSPTIEGHNWSYKSITIRRGAISSQGGVAHVRATAISLLQRMYFLSEAVDYRKMILQTMDAATRREQPSEDPDTSQMFVRDAVTVLEFLAGLVVPEKLPLVQTIEHQAYWNFYHAASPEIAEKALAVRDAVDLNPEYQIYKNLIGFEGIFGSWEDLRRDESAWRYDDEHRQSAARGYVESIGEQNFDEWLTRILQFSETRSSDLATFPVFYVFLELIGHERPTLAIRLITQHTEQMQPFLIPLLSGLWSSANSRDAKAIVEAWIARGHHLTPAVRSLHKTRGEHLDILHSIVIRASQLRDLDALLSCIGIAATLFAAGENSAKEEFMAALRQLSMRKESRWVNVIWFNRDFKSLIAAMSEVEIQEVLVSLTWLPQISYQSEEILSAIYVKDPARVLDYLIQRITAERDTAEADQESFEAIPYSLPKLGKLLAKDPELLLRALRPCYDAEDRGMFTYRGARLVRAALPEFDPQLEAALAAYVTEDDQAGLGFVSSILRCYDGSTAIIGLCKKIVAAAPLESPILSGVASALLSTGVVSGEYGLVHAYEGVQSSLRPWASDDNNRVRAFGEELVQSLEGIIEREKARADEGVALRKYKYGGDEAEEDSLE
ncbi:hypothetical protein ACFQ4Q_05935 [Lysobacter gummosus]|uniref:hypothetical protein n=1 Tax=Lysobacter gummosus TaxID=262324 RepID=UPI00363E4F0E